MNCPACTCPMTNPNFNRPDWWECPHPDCKVAGTDRELTARRRGPIRAEVEACLKEDRQKGKPVNPLTRPARRADRLAELATIICPLCTIAGNIIETVAPTDQHTGHYACRTINCTWSGPGKALRPDPSADSQAQAVDRWGNKTDKDVAAALAAERKRGKKGGGSSNGTGKAKSKKATRYRPDREENVWTNLRAANPLEKVVRLPGVERPNDSMRKAVGQYIDDQRRGEQV